MQPDACSWLVLDAGGTSDRVQCRRGSEATERGEAELGMGEGRSSLSMSVTWLNPAWGHGSESGQYGGDYGREGKGPSEANSSPSPSDDLVGVFCV